MRQGMGGNHAAQDKLRRQERDAATKLRDARKHVLSSPMGRHFYWSLIEAGCNTFGEVWAPGQQDATHIAIGMRRVGIELMQWAQRDCPDEYLQMMAEQTSARKLADAVRTDAASTPPPEEDNGD